MCTFSHTHTHTHTPTLMGDERWEKCQRRRRRRRHKRDPSVCRINFFLSVFCLPAIYLFPYFICLAVYLYSVSPWPSSTTSLQAYKAPVTSVSPFSSRAHTGKCHDSLRSLRRKALEKKPSRHFHGTLSPCLKSISPHPTQFFKISFLEEQALHGDGIIVTTTDNSQIEDVSPERISDAPRRLWQL